MRKKIKIEVNYPNDMDITSAEEKMNILESEIDSLSDKYLKDGQKSRKMLKMKDFTKLNDIFDSAINLSSVGSVKEQSTLPDVDEYNKISVRTGIVVKKYEALNDAYFGDSVNK